MSDQAQVRRDVATSVLSGHDRGEVWETDLAPGQATALHHHAMEDVLAEIDGDRIAGVLPEGSEPETRPGEVTGVGAARPSTCRQG